jgi:hypothetical protein
VSDAESGESLPVSSLRNGAELCNLSINLVAGAGRKRKKNRRKSDCKRRVLIFDERLRAAVSLFLPLIISHYFGILSYQISKI